MPFIAQCLFTGAIVFSGLNAVGVIKSCQLIAGRFVYIIMAIHQFTNSCIVLLLPFLVAYIAPDSTREQWAQILVFIAVLVVAAILFFDLNAEATERAWALNKSSHPQKDQNIRDLINAHPTTIDVLSLTANDQEKSTP